MLMLTVMFCLAYLISDILYAVLNPRIRHGGRANDGRVAAAARPGLVCVEAVRCQPGGSGGRRSAGGHHALAIFAPLVTPTGPNAQDFLTESLFPPSAAHWFGVDDLGRDFWTRIVYGARVSLSIGFAAALCSVLIGIPLGALAGYYGGAVDWVVMRVIEIFSVVPPLLAAMLLGALTGGGSLPSS